MSTFLHIQVPGPLLAAAAGGDAAAQRKLYEALARPVYTLLRRLVVRPAVAEELLQEVFIEVLRKLGACRDADSFPGWVRSIAVSRALMHLRSPWQRRLLPDGAAALLAQPAPAPEGEAWSAALERALNALPAQGRAIVWLHDVEGYTHEEIAQLYGRTTAFSKSQLARAHAALRAWLEPDTGEQSCPQVTRI
jgi:RNA polymerase sigma factor (sigma-70 family)